jgi:hypothetical protein
MDVIQTIEQLFATHAPETLMALFGAVTSIGLFYLVWTVLRGVFSLWTQDASEEQATAALVDSLVSALVSEAGHLRQTLDGILGESLRSSEQNARALAVLLARAEKIPEGVLQLLKPEFDQLHQEIAQTEARLLSKVAEKRVEEVQTPSNRLEKR